MGRRRPGRACAGLVLAGLLGFPGVPQGQPAPAGAPVVVTATRLEQAPRDVAAAVTVVGEEDLQRGRPAVTVAEGLSGIPGVFATNRSNFAQDLRLSVRGFGARSTFGIRGVRVLLDGIPLTLPDGQTGVDAIDPGVLARAEVLRGPSGALYGAASGGVVSLTSERGTGREPFAAARVTAGDHGLLQRRLEAGGSSGPVDAFLSLSELTLDGYRDHAATERVLATGNLGLLTPGGAELTLVASVVDSPRAQDPGGLTRAQVQADRRQAGPLNLRFDTGETVRQQRLGATWAQPAGAGGELRARAYGTWRDFSNRLPFSGVRLERVFRGAGVEYASRVDPAGGGPRLLLGAELQHQDDDRVRVENDDGVLGDATSAQREQVTSQGAYGQVEWGLTGSLRADLGLRHDRVRVDVDDRFLADGDDSGAVTFTETSPSAGLLWRLPGETRAWLRAATGFETPTTAELTDPGGLGGFNEALEAETARSLEVGLRGQPLPWAAAELVAYRTEVDGLLVQFPIDPGRFAFENAGEARLEGVEAALSAERGAWRLRASWSVQDARYRRFTDREGRVLDGNRIPGVPRHLGSLALTWDPGAGPWVALEARRVGARYADNANRVEADGYLVTDLRGGYARDLGGLEVEGYAGVENLLDEAYDANVRVNARGGRYFEPAPRRSAYLGIRLQARF